MINFLALRNVIKLIFPHQDRLMCVLVYPQRGVSVRSQQQEIKIPGSVVPNKVAGGTSHTRVNNIKSHYRTCVTCLIVKRKIDFLSPVRHHLLLFDSSSFTHFTLIYFTSSSSSSMCAKELLQEDDCLDFWRLFKIPLHPPTLIDIQYLSIDWRWNLNWIWIIITQRNCGTCSIVV